MNIVCLDLEGVLVPEIWLLLQKQVESLELKERRETNGL